MDTILYFFQPLVELLTIATFLAVTFVATYIFAEKTSVGRKVMNWIGCGDEFNVDLEDNYTNFTIHPSNYIRPPSR